MRERALQAELTGHLGYEKYDPAGSNSGNSRNGVTRKTLTTPRDRKGTFEPLLVGRYQTRWTGFDESILSMYSRGMSTREIQGHLEEMYQVEVSPAFISTVTSGVAEKVKEWQNRPLEAVYPIPYMDALYVKMRDNGQVENRAVFVAIGVNLEGNKDLPGRWVTDNEGSKFWLKVLTDPKNRGVKDVFIFPALQALKPREFVLDGEIAIQIKGELSFDDLLMRIHPAESRIRKPAAETPATYSVFDLLVDDRNHLLADQPLKDRRPLLEHFAARYFEGSI